MRERRGQGLVSRHAALLRLSLIVECGALVGTRIGRGIAKSSEKFLPSGLFTEHPTLKLQQLNLFLCNKGLAIVHNLSAS
jgi:hypothetical protein